MFMRLKLLLSVLFLSFIGFPSFVEAHTDSLELEGVQDRLGVPTDLARVTDVSWPTDKKIETTDMLPDSEDSSIVPQPSSLPDFILIQDVHRYAEVQARIATLVVMGYERWGVKKVFMEGAFTPLDFALFHRVPDKTQKMLMERLVKEGDLSGPELAAVQIMEREWRDPPVSPFQLFGMEDPSLYKQNVAAYRSVLAVRERALEEVSAIRRLQLSMALPEEHPMVAELNRLEALLRLKLIPTDYDAYLKAKGMAPSAPSLDPAVRAAEEFYRLAELRSQVFLKEAMRKVPASSAPRILVMGGFHTSAIADLLRQSNRSYIVLSPTVSSDGGEPIYEKRMQETATVLTQALRPVPR